MGALGNTTAARTAALTPATRHETLPPVPDSDAAKREVARRLMAAIEAGDVAAVGELYADDMVGWRSFDRRELGRDAMLRVIEWLVKHVRDRHYQAIRVETTERGYVQQHVLHATAPDGSKLEAPACLVVEVRGGKIRRLDEYIDSAAIAPLLRR
jgi:ketosteroid isomerase-like protein